MLQFAIILFLIGLVGIIGPGIIRFVLALLATIEPVSGGVTCFLMGIIAAEIIASIYLRSCYHGRLFQKYRDDKSGLRRLQRDARNFFEFTNKVALWTFLIVVANPIFKLFSEKWGGLMDEHPTVFGTIRYVGIVMIAMSIAYLVGRYTTKKKKQPVQYVGATKKKERNVIEPEIIPQEPSEEEKDFSFEFENLKFLGLAIFRVDSSPKVDYIEADSDIVTEDELDIHLPGEAKKKLG